MMLRKLKFELKNLVNQMHGDFAYLNCKWNNRINRYRQKSLIWILSILLGLANLMVLGQVFDTRHKQAKQERHH